MQRIFLIFIVGFVIFAHDGPFAQHIRSRLPEDSSRVHLRLGNPFLKKQKTVLALSPGQRLKNYLFENRRQFYQQVHQPFGTGKRPAAPWTVIDWSLSAPGASIPGLDYRESSLFVPVNVREYIDYKMGRSRYLPVATLAAAAFLAGQLYQHYGYLLQRREAERYDGLELNRQEIELLGVLWEYPGSTPEEWFTHWNRSQKTGAVTFLAFEKVVNRLEGKFLLNPRTLEDGGKRYFPAISKSDLRIRLEDEATNLDALRNLERLEKIQEMLRYLEED